MIMEHDENGIDAIVIIGKEHFYLTRSSNEKLFDEVFHKINR